MRMRTRALIAAAVLAVGVALLALAISRHGFSAREKPSWMEAMLARHARRIATPAGARELQNPFPLTPERLASARAHWVDHCATCHALEGSGKTALGRNMYPPAPDLRDPTTQDLKDGELFYIISNGVRFTGMPAWGGEHNPEETWTLVAFIRRLPTLSAEEHKQMEDMAIGKGAAEAASHSHGSEEKPEAHRH